MNSFSLLGFIISLIIFLLFLVEVINFFKSFKKGKRLYIPIHLIGLNAAALITLFTMTSSFGVQIGTNTLVTVTVALTFICFIVLSFDSLRIEKIEKVRSKKVRREIYDKN